jgi:hypothetical protein
MPTCLRTCSTALTSSVSAMPSTVTRPCWYSSSALTQRISVDLPEPDGPQMTMRSPLATSRSMSRSTWKSLPYHLLTLSKRTMDSVITDSGWSRDQRVRLTDTCFSTHRL